MRLRVCILTPDCIFQEKKADELILPTRTGQIGVLSNHAPLITALDIGLIIFRQRSDWKVIALIGGFAVVQENKVTILVNEVVDATSVNEDEARIELEKSDSQLNQVTEEKRKVEATFAYKRARARYQIIQWKKLYIFKNFYVEVSWTTSSSSSSSWRTTSIYSKNPKTEYTSWTTWFES
jgi:ATP synthase F1 epsilon subunit